MSSSLVRFGDLFLKDEVYAVTDDAGNNAHGIVTGIGPGRELILDGDRQITVSKNSLLLVVNEDSR